MGLHRAGFEVVGVDNRPQPHYPFEFHQADALEFLGGVLDWFDLIWASPPCQSFTAYRRKGHGVGEGYLNLIPGTRERLRQARYLAGAATVIENVPGSPLVDPFQLCGSSFGLDVRRHRVFEASFPVLAPACNHAWQTPRYPCATNRKNPRSTVEIGVWRIPLEVQHRAMGIDWMTLEELSQSIPPAYSEWIGRRALEAMA
jgi:DNA (cytosine-5)-methyltransferase 1